MHVFVACKNDVVNKQLVSPLWLVGWIIYSNNLQTSRCQGKTLLGSWESLTPCRR